jgi:ATP-dependent exoDNAse (exonuclease V) alpha subunit
MIERLCGAGDGVAVVVGRAGSGKTYALGAARDAWQAAGYAVFGVAIARRAARELEDGAGIASTSVAAYLSVVRRGVETPPERCVLVVDEAGMLPTRQLGELIDSIDRVHGKLVLVGDHRQLPELEAGGAFRGLVHRGLAIELNDNRRQVHPWERVALDHLREGRSEQALELYRRHDRLVVQDTPDRARAQLVEDWSRTSDADRAVMIAHRRDDVADLNLRARQRLRRAGALGEDELALPGGGFAVGDRVVVRRNHLRLGVHNGDRATVVAVDLDHGRLTIASRGARITLDSGFLCDRTAHGEPTLAHGYAITAHVAQGLTVDHALVLADERITPELAYTALSRGRQTNRLYVAACPDDPRAEYAPTAPERTDGLKRLTAALRTSSKASLAIDVGMPVAENQRLTQAEEELRTMSRQRRALEARRGSWLPGRRAAIKAARRAEAVAGEHVAELRIHEAERRHGERPFVSDDDLAARVARSQQRAAERRVARALGRGRGREL